MDWAGLREGLRDGGYQGWVVAETFTGTIPEIAAATAIWRPVVADGWTYAREAVAFCATSSAGAPRVTRGAPERGASHIRTVY